VKIYGDCVLKRIGVKDDNTNLEPLIKFMNKNSISREEILYIGDALIDY
jgi:hypothetical protein